MLVNCKQKRMLGAGCEKHCPKHYQNFAWLECGVQIGLCVSSIKIKRLVQL